MPAVDEELIRQITEKVTREVLASIRESDDVTQVADSYPDWNEYVEDGVLAEPAYEAALSGAYDEPRKPHPLRARATGDVSVPVVDDDTPDEPFTVDLPLPSPEVRGGFTPGDDWIAAQYVRLPASYRQAKPPAVALEAWAEVV